MLISGLLKSGGNASKEEFVRITEGKDVFSGGVRLSPLHLGNNCPHLRSNFKEPKKYRRVMEIGARDLEGPAFSMMTVCVKCSGVRGFQVSMLSEVVRHAKNMSEVRSTIGVYASLHPEIKYEGGVRRKK